ncbi:MAG: acetylxylan esterase [Planctomycetaceae bacterium]|nr:acetylxylan esterase [Planctomycetaceae bacterium]
MILPRYLLLLTLCPVGTSLTWAQDEPVNYDEAKVPAYELPDPLVMEDGTPVETSEQWYKHRRPELLGLFEEHVFGRTPKRSLEVSARMVNECLAFSGRALRREFDLSVPGKSDGPIRLLIYSPTAVKEPAPAFLALNFMGNHSIQPDPEITLSTQWIRSRAGHGIEGNRATEASRGKLASRWPVERILSRGYAVATAYYGDIDPDFDDGFSNGVHAALDAKPGADREPGEWGSIGAWAWGLSRALDFLEEDGVVDAKRVALLGHSRLGKTALWAGATDERFALVISNNSGCGGAALSRRCFGETVARINRVFPHWFCERFRSYDNHESRLPVDQHQLIALIAPRPVLICSAEEDRWADPLGEQLAARAAAPVFRFLDSASLVYRLRPGKHDVTAEDWTAYMDFADREM